MSYQLPTYCPHKPVSITNNHPRSHNLNIQSYSLEEILGIFDLNLDISIEDLKRAKKKVLMVHPDKSRLPPDYFLFYKKAYEIILDFYKNNHKHEQEIPTEPVEYKPIYHNDKQTNQQIQGIASKMNREAFSSEFNRLFDEHMYVKPDETKNEWFKTDTPAYTYDGKVTANNMTQTFQSMKHQHQQNMLINYRGVKELNSAGAGVSSYYGDGNIDYDNEVYVCSDPFSKLKYEDLRKVHKDQTIFAVSETDIDKVAQYGNVEEYTRARSVNDLSPMEKKQAEAILANKQREQYELLIKKQHEDKLRVMRNEEKNRVIQARFLQLEQGK